METKNGHILTFLDTMQICAVSCFATCDWFCPMTSHYYNQSGVISVSALEHCRKMEFRAYLHLTLTSKILYVVTVE